MVRGQSFSDILKEQMGITSATPPSSSGYTEEKQSLWVQVLPYIKQEQWTFKYKSPYPKNFNATAHTATETYVEVVKVEPTPPPPPSPELRADELHPLQVGWLELLIRKKWIARKDRYGWSEWKRSHRQAVRALHPDTGAQGSASEFSLVHEAFKGLEGHFKVY